MFKQLRIKKRHGFPESRRAWQNLPGVIAVILILFSGSFLLSFSKKKPPEKFEFSRQIRVHLGAQDKIELGTSGEMIIECYRDGERGEIYYTSSIISAADSAGGIVINDDNGILATGLSSVIFKPRFPNVFLDFDGNRYRGFIECDVDGDISQVRVFNIIDIESYLKGVLPGEIGERSEDEIEAAKAQAIAARTYAIWRLSTQNDDKHLKNSIDDQLYLGAGEELPLLNKAVEETEGLIMTYHDEPIAAYYHAVCGGSTAPIDKVWDSSEISYLQSAVDGDYCQWARTFFWNEKFSIDKLSANLSDYFGQRGELPRKGFGRISSLRFKKDDSIGRMVEFKIKTTTGEFTVEKDQIRWAIKKASSNNGILPSTRFNARILKSAGTLTGLELVGAGNGHGVGMCQCGAIGRARNGFKSDEILHTYYNDISIVKIY
jgi:stage II sporulation protein D